MKLAKITALLLAIVMMFTLFAGCSDSDSNEKEANGTQNTTTTTTTTLNEKDPDGDGIDKIEVLPPDDGFSFTYDSGSSATLPALEYNASNVRTAQWVFEANGSKISVTSVYCTDNGLVSNLIMRVELDSSTPSYSTLLSDMKSYINAAESLNDSKIYTLMNEGYSFSLGVVNVNGLQDSDREARVALAEAVMDLTPDSSKKAFYYESVKAQLEGYGFVAQ